MQEFKLKKNKKVLLVYFNRTFKKSNKQYLSHYTYLKRHFATNISHLSSNGMHERYTFCMQMQSIGFYTI